MQKIFAIAWKDAIIRFSGPAELLFFIVLPLVFTFLLAGGTPSGEEDPRIGLLVVDEANTVISQRMIAELKSSTAVRPELVTRDEAQSQFDDRRADVVFIIPTSLDLASVQSDAAEAELLQQPNNINAIIAERAVLTAIRRVSSSIAAARSSSPPPLGPHAKLICRRRMVTCCHPEVSTRSRSVTSCRVGASANPHRTRSISPGLPPGGSTSTGSAISARGTWRPVSSWCARPAVSSAISTAARPCWPG